MSLNDANLLDEELYSNLQMAMKKLGEKLLPQIYELGFLQDEVVMYD